VKIRALQFVTPSYLIIFLITAIVLLPFFWLILLAVSGETEHWQHLTRYVLPHAITNTILLVTGIAVMVSIIGAGCAWLVTAYDFPARKILSWALFLPLAMPTYIVAFVWLDILHPLGPVQELIRALLGFDSPRQFRLPDIRSMLGAILLLGIVLYPYVYLTLRAVFVTQPAHLLEAARILGQGPWGCFFRVVLPMARPALAVGIALALLETLNDIGASEFLGINTLTVTVYTTWVTRSDLAGAAQIACTMLAFIIFTLSLEYYGRKNQRYGVARQTQGISPKRLDGWRAVAAFTFTFLPVLFGFLLPALFLLWESYKRLPNINFTSSDILQHLQNSLFLALSVTLTVTIASLFVVWFAREKAVRSHDGALRRFILRLNSLGYALPGTVLAIGLISPALMFDRTLANFLGVSGLPLLSLGVVLIIGCSIRFLTLSIGSIDAGLGRIAPSLEQSARLLGSSEAGVFFRIHLPLLKPALATGALLVFADVMKELSTTLLLRPVNFETLATVIYAEAARGTYEEGALAALLIVLAGIGPVILLAKVQLSHNKV